MNKDTNDILRWMRLAEGKEESEPEETEEPEDLESKKGKGKITRQRVLDWFVENPNPDDDALHAWAEEMGWDEHEVEEQVYRILTDYALMLKKEKDEK
jgi:hypothetical protein